MQALNTLTKATINSYSSSYETRSGHNDTDYDTDNHKLHMH